ncbi:phage virion morphogenesis protein [Elioraea sp.]|uniref:phage virion morphogenesis protein n=1 Tax=Elioraea sp. TaxID=2185103 RepID=UPI00307CC803
MITIKLGVEDTIRTALRRVLDATGDLTPVMREIGEALVESTRQRFRLGRAPDGTPWAPNSPVTVARFLARFAGARRKGGRGPTKRGQGLAAAKRPLIGESRALSTQIAWRADARSVEVGSPLVYAATQQFGAAQGAFGTTRRGAPIPWGTIPARPFLGLSREDAAPGPSPRGRGTSQPITS